jgi:Malectin domain
MQTPVKSASVHCFSALVHYALFYICILFMSGCYEVSAVGEVIWAVNCGGDMHVDTNGVRYQKDVSKVGYASEHGRSLNIRRIPPPDMILYQTERYHTSNFAYDVQIREDGDYVLVMKFSEVWFTEAGRKVRIYDDLFV